jgi:hypothetical protein
MTYDDYDDEDYDYDQTGSYGADVAHSPGSSSFLYTRPQTAAEIAAQHHRDQLTAKSKQNTPAPQATASSSAFFRTKPAKGKKGGSIGAGAGSGVSANNVGAGRGGWSGSTDRDGGAAAEELFGGEDFDAETAAAIEASAKEAKEREKFMAEAGLTKQSGSAAVSSVSVPAAGPSVTQLRSHTDQQATLAALEELRLEKQRQAAGTTPQRGVSSSVGGVQRSPSLNSMGPSSGNSSVSGSPTIGAIKIDRPNMPVPTRTLPSTLTIPSAAAALAAEGSQPTTPSRSLNASPAPLPSASPAPSPTGSSAAAAAAAAAGSRGVGLFELPDVGPAVPSAKRTREVAAVIAADAERVAGESGIQKDRLNMVVIGHVDSGNRHILTHTWNVVRCVCKMNRF